MNIPLLDVKLFLPLPIKNPIERPNLIRQLEGARSHCLTLISAPAGFGKSSLVSMWIHVQRSRQETARTEAAGWLSLDAADNDPVRFWTYFVAAIKTGYETAGFAQDDLALGRLIDLLRSDPPPPIQLVLDGIIGAVTARPEQMILILDDYHVIHSAQVHEQVTYLLDHLPRNLHLVIATRSDPPLPITRLRVRGQLNEIRAAALRFTRAEIEQFLAGATGLQFPVEDIRALEESTEGWIAGLQMAVLAMQGTLEPAAYQAAHALIQSFSGKHVYILDYLADEVFNRQPERIQEFLLKTAVLDRFCVGLCDAVMAEQTGQAAASAPVWSSREILTYLEKANLFLIPLDSERQWFRYHHLFTDLLRVRLEQTWPERIPELHTLAAQWYERSGFVEEAITHALTAQDWDRAAALLERHIQTFLQRGQLSGVMEWAARLPKEIAAQRAWLTIQQATIMGMAHRLNEFAELISASEKAIDRLEKSGTASAVEIRQLRCNTLFQRGYYALATRQPQQAMRLALEGLQSLPENCPWEAFWLYWLRAYANRSLNHLTLAEEGFQQALEAIEGQDLWTDMICLTDQAMVCHLRGDLLKACDLYEQALELGRKRRASGHSYLNRVEGWLSLVLLERNEVEAASIHARTGLEWSQYWPSTNARCVTFIVLGRVEMIQGDLAGAEAWFEKAEQERQKSPLMPVNNSLLDYSLVRFWLAKGDLKKAVQWAKPFQESWRHKDRARGLDESLEMQLIALARVLIAQGKQGNAASFVEALELLDVIRNSAQACERVNALIEADVLKASALQEQYQSMTGAERASREALQTEAMIALEEGLAAGEPGGYMRIFLDEGPGIAALLRTLRLRTILECSPKCGKAYLDRLLAAFPADGETQNSRPNPPSPALPEPLTERELEVLRLLSSGLSNREMAERLVLSEGTIKTHVHNIMGKLAAQSRTRAIAIAKELGIL